MNAQDDSPVFIFDDGWFELPWRATSAEDARYGYRVWDVELRWRAVPQTLREHAWLVLYVPWRLISVSRDAGDVYKEIAPEPDPLYAEKLSAFRSGLDYAQDHGIPILLMVRRWAKNRFSAPDYDLVESLLEDYTCVKGLYYNELGGSGLRDADAEHLKTFTAMAKAAGRKALWAIYCDKSFPAWSFLMADPVWRNFLAENKDVIVPLWKNVEPFNNMLLWSSCVGMWLSGLVGDWGFEFDDWHWINYFCHSRGMHRSEFAPAFHGEDSFEMCGMNCPPYLVKDTMILSAMTGAKYFQTEADPSFVPYDSPYGSSGGSLRSVRQKVAELIATEGVRRSLAKVASNVRLAVETPAQPGDLARCGCQYTFTDEGPNVLFKETLGIPAGDLGTLPRKAPFFLPPLIPPGKGARLGVRTLAASEMAGGPELLCRALSERSASPLTSDDPDVLVFDAGDVVYVTDGRAEGRTSRIVSLTDASCGEYEFISLSADSTPVKVKAPPVKRTSVGCEMRLPLFAGGSFLLRRR